MAVVVNRHAADVEADFAGFDGDEFFFLAGEGVVYFQHGAVSLEVIDCQFIILAHMGVGLRGNAVDTAVISAWIAGIQLAWTLPIPAIPGA